MISNDELKAIEVEHSGDTIDSLCADLRAAREALRFYGGNTDEGGLAFMPLSTGGGFRATESKPGERARKALGEE